MQRRALAAYQTVAAVGIGAWWIYWFASGSNTHGTACALRYENGFPVADLTLAGVLAGSALDLARGRQRAWILGPLAAGMAFSLATLDTSHNLVTGGFAHSALRKVVFAAVNGSDDVVQSALLRRSYEFSREPAGAYLGPKVRGLRLGEVVFPLPGKPAISPWRASAFTGMITWPPD